MTSLYEPKHLINVDNNLPCDCAGCRGDSIESDASEWPDWTDDDCWAPGPETDGLDEPELYPSLDAWVEAQSDRYDALETDAARLVAEELRALAFKIRMTDARTADEYRARVDRLEDDAQEAHRSAGYLDGLAAGRSERDPLGTMFGHPA